MLVVHGGNLGTAKADVEGAGRGRGDAHRLLGSPVIGRDEHVHARQPAHEADILEHLMAAAVWPDGDARMRGSDLDVETRIANGIANLVVAASRAESCEAAGEDGLARKREAGRDADHVLLGDADVDETEGIVVLELLGGGGPGQVGLNGHDVMALLDELDERLAIALTGRDGLRHGYSPPSSSASASLACSSLGALPCHPAWFSMNETPLPLTVWATMHTGEPSRSVAVLSAVTTAPTS